MKILENSGQVPLAYLTAATHGMTAKSEQLGQQLKDAGQQLPPIDPNAKLLAGPPPLSPCDENWPLLTVSRGVFDSILFKSQKHM